jgi:hypothetical protein
MKAGGKDARDGAERRTCPHCGAAGLLVRKPKYDGFRRIGEEIACAACGQSVASEEELGEAPKTIPAIFADDDRPRPADLFRGESIDRLCRHCRHYVVNPFRQWCGRHRRDVAATDTCPQFAAKEAAPSSASEDADRGAGDD